MPGFLSLSLSGITTSYTFSAFYSSLGDISQAAYYEGVTLEKLPKARRAVAGLMPAHREPQGDRARTHGTGRKATSSFNK